jgi:HEAT repeat protein
MDACARGECAPEQARWFEPKQPEELYDVAADPDNVRNLAGDPKHAEALRLLRAENARHIATIRDSVFYPEGMRGREYAAYQSDETYPLARLTALAARVSEGRAGALPAFVEAMRDENAAVRYWGVMGCIVLGEQGGRARGALRRLLDDAEPLIRIQAARALAGMGDVDRALPAVRRMLAHDDPSLRLRAALVVDECGLLAVDPELESLLRNVDDQYADRVAERILSTGRVNGPG